SRLSASRTGVRLTPICSASRPSSSLSPERSSPVRIKWRTARYAVSTAPIASPGSVFPIVSAVCFKPPSLAATALKGMQIQRKHNPISSVDLDMPKKGIHFDRNADIGPEEQPMVTSQSPYIVGIGGTQRIGSTSELAL